MTMQSLSLLPALQELPSNGSAQDRSFRENITRIVNMDRATSAAEFASAVSFGMWGIFDRFNVDDRLLGAYETRWSTMSNEISLHDKVRELTESGEFTGTDSWLFNGLKGKLAEFEAEDWLNSSGYTEVNFPDTEVNLGWDVRAVNPEGQEVFISVKTGISDSQYYKTLEAMGESDYLFAVGSELHDRISESSPELVDRLIDVGSDYDLVEGIQDGLDTLSGNMGIDIPDGVGEILPYAGVIFATARMIVSIIKTEKDFEAADRTTKNKIQFVQTLTLLSRMGPKTVLSIVGGKGGAIVGGAAGTLAGTVAPGVGNAVGGLAGSVGGGIGGAVVGYKTGNYLSKHLEPHALNLALNITGLTNDDLFYFKNKVRVDGVVVSYQNTSRKLAALPAW